MLLNDKQIEKLAKEKNMISPFLGELVRVVDPTSDHKVGALSYGLSSFGYDVRLAPEAQIFVSRRGCIIDPKRPNKVLLSEAILNIDNVTGEQYFIMPPHSYLLGRTLEYFDMPRNVTAIVLGKSTYARSALLCNTTPIEAGFKGQVVIELSNPSELPIKVYANEGIAQFLFLSGQDCAVSYEDRGGKYQGQVGITHSRV